MSSERILGLNFFVGCLDAAVVEGASRGLVVLPSAPVLVALEHDAWTREALLGADLVLPDSGLMVALWRLLCPGTRLRRISGLRYIERIISDGEILREQRTAWVMPTQKACDRLIGWLQKKGQRVDRDVCYVAPQYPAGRIYDADLLAFLRERKADHVFVALGGGTQERLGLFLKNHSGQPVRIHCIGAAIGFLTGDQAAIPKWADALYLGWLVRCLNDPCRFVPRYWGARKCASILVRHRRSLPPSSEVGSASKS